MKALMLICDGMADRPLKELNGRTPLEAARTPNMDKLAKRGICGLMDTIAPGVPPGSDTAHLALLGHDPFRVYTGRGPFEAAGAGIELRPGDIAFRVNYATVDDALIVRDRRAGRIRETKALESAIEHIRLRGVEFTFKNTIGHRATLVLRGKGLSHEITDSDPHETGKKVASMRPLPQAFKRPGLLQTILTGGIRRFVGRRRRAAKTARLLNDFSRRTHEILESHPLNAKRVKEGLSPANYLLLRGGGVVPHLQPLQERFNIRGACVAAAALVKGVCRMVGMKVVDVPGATGSVDTDLNAKSKAVLKELETHELVLLHVKGFDEASHDGNATAKVQLIERADEVLKPLIDAADLVTLAIDHTTPVTVREHTGDPVPVVIAGTGVRADDVRVYNEHAAAKGGLGHILGKDLMPITANLMGKIEKFGA
jgi:2,3-bisphosphoglycerate-independent phosphoglycerate mutase